MLQSGCNTDNQDISKKSPTIKNHHDSSLQNSQPSSSVSRSNGAGGGCALLTSSGFILSGSEISNSISGITPLQVALVSLGANGLCPSTVLSVAYAGQVGQLLGDEKLREQVPNDEIVQRRMRGLKQAPPYFC